MRYEVGCTSHTVTLLSPIIYHFFKSHFTIIVYINHFYYIFIFRLNWQWAPNFKWNCAPSVSVENQTFQTEMKNIFKIFFQLNPHWWHLYGDWCEWMNIYHVMCTIQMSHTEVKSFQMETSKIRVSKIIL